MKKIDLGQTITILANLGVIGGLVFVGMQLLHDRKVSEVFALYEATNMLMYWRELAQESPDVWTKGLAGEQLSPDEAAKFDQIAADWSLMHYTAYAAQPLMGLEAEKFVREWALQLYMHPGLQVWWEAEKRHISYVDPQTGPGTGTYIDEVDLELRRLNENPPPIVREMAEFGRRPFSFE